MPTEYTGMASTDGTRYLEDDGEHCINCGALWPRGKSHECEAMKKGTPRNTNPRRAVAISDEVWRRVKAEAALAGLSINDWLERQLLLALSPDPSGPPPSDWDRGLKQTQLFDPDAIVALKAKQEES